MTLEKLLNILCEKGWKPFDMEATRIEYSGGPEFLLRYKGRNKNGEGWNVRNLVSKESGLWQYVCENGMVKSIGSEIEIKNLNEGYGVVRDTDYQYRLIESALCDEDKLEEFLLQNIKVDG